MSKQLSGDAGETVESMMLRRMLPAALLIVWLAASAEKAGSFWIGATYQDFVFLRALSQGGWNFSGEPSVSESSASHF